MKLGMVLLTDMVDKSWLPTITDYTDELTTAIDNLGALLALLEGGENTPNIGTAYEHIETAKDLLSTELGRLNDIRYSQNIEP